MEKSCIYWSLLVYRDWRLFVAATKEGLCYVGAPNQSFEEMSLAVRRHFPNIHLIEAEENLETYKQEISEYLDGNRENFTLPMDLHGTPFQLAVWNSLCKIPYGKTTSYSEIAIEINKATAARAVGTAIGANPILIVVPCHRVIGKNGSLVGYRGGLEMKRSLLELENKREYHH